jgi:N-acetylglutamate synthase/N-acetylornithine aminotransferase
LSATAADAAETHAKHRAAKTAKAATTPNAGRVSLFIGATPNQMMNDECGMMNEEGLTR